MNRGFSRRFALIILATATLLALTFGASACSKSHLESVGMDKYGNETLPEDTAPAIQATLSFEHTKPGSYSTVKLSIASVEGDKITATLSGPSVDNPATKNVTVTADMIKSGKVEITWIIRQYGDYTAKGNVNGAEFSKSVKVQ
jgi:hypothetical protein